MTNLAENTATTTPTTLTELCARLLAIVPLAIADSAAIEKAETDARQAEADVIAAVAVIAAALAGVNMWARLVSRYWATAGANGCNPVERKDHHERRAIVIHDDTERTRDETGNRGRFTGSRVVLRSDGTFALLEREGQWSSWQGEADEWTETVRELTPRDVARHVDAADVLRAVLGALETWLSEPSAPVVAELEADAERYRAALAVLESLDGEYLNFPGGCAGVRTAGGAS